MTILKQAKKCCSGQLNFKVVKMVKLISLRACLEMEQLMRSRIDPFTPEAYDNDDYNKANDYVREDYEDHAPFDVNDYDDWKDHAGIPNE